MSDIASVTNLGKFWAGDTGPAISIVLANSQGGYFNGTGAFITGFIRRWDARRSAPVGRIIGDGTITEIDIVNGLYQFDWLQSSIGSVPVDPGAYVLQLDIIDASGAEQLSQRGLFEVLSSSPRPS